MLGSRINGAILAISHEPGVVRGELASSERSGAEFGETIVGLGARGLAIDEAVEFFAQFLGRLLQISANIGHEFLYLVGAGRMVEQRELADAVTARRHDVPFGVVSVEADHDEGIVVVRTRFVEVLEIAFTPQDGEQEGTRRGSGRQVGEYIGKTAYALSSGRTNML